MKKKGFTILELLVVVAIIGIMAAAAIALMSSARLKSRDARRIQDIKQVQNALSLFSASNRNLFPSMGVGNPTVPPNCYEFDGNQTSAFALALRPTHMPTIPTYQQYNAATMYARYCSYGGSATVGSATANSFAITFCLEGNGIKGYVAGCTNVIRP